MPLAANDGLTWPAPAKLNLFLNVNGRRADGYHEIQTLFQLLDWGDSIRIKAVPGQDIVRISANYGVPDDQDLAIRAARLLQHETGSRRGAAIEVTKRIPMGAGLGGGSSDAATILLVLNQLWGTGLGAGELAEIGLQLGADVPVFILGHSAFAEGLGERLSPVSLGPRHYLLVMPDLQIPTKTVFTDPGLRRDSARIDVTQALDGSRINHCEATAMKLFPELAPVRNELLRIVADTGGADAFPGELPTMTGTGSAFFLRMNSRRSAEAAARGIKCRYNVRAVQGVDRSKLHEMLLDSSRAVSGHT